jgi:predicted nucleotidyltransferase
MNTVHLTNTEKKVVGELKHALREMLGERLISITLFGSRTRGDYDADSDIDIAVIVRDLTREVKNQILERVAEIEFDFVLPLSVLVFSEQDFNHLKKRERKIAIEITNEGIPL